MRPIDADALQELVKGHGCNNCPGGALQCTFCTLNQFIAMIDSAPTLDVQPVRRGEWVHGRRNGAYGIWCSRCGTGWAESPNYEVIAASHNFCPNCGADMRGRNE